MSLEEVRAVADAVLYEGYLLYPYRASAAKNQARWQFGVLGPPGAPFGEPPGMAMQCLLRGHDGADPSVTVHLRFLQLQARTVEPPSPDLLSWDEAVAHEITLPAARSLDQPVTIFGGEDVELFDVDGVTGRIVRRRWPLAARVRMSTTEDDGYRRLTVAVENVAADAPAEKDHAIRTSFLGAHLLLEAHGGEFVSLLDPP